MVVYGVASHWWCVDQGVDIDHVEDGLLVGDVGHTVVVGIPRASGGVGVGVGTIESKSRSGAGYKTQASKSAVKFAMY